MSPRYIQENKYEENLSSDYTLCRRHGRMMCQECRAVFPCAECEEPDVCRGMIGNCALRQIAREPDVLLEIANKEGS